MNEMDYDDDSAASAAAAAAYEIGCFPAIAVMQ